MGEELAIEALKQGATDYVFKTRLSRIAPCVRRALREAGERSHRRRAEDELHQLVDFVPQVIVGISPDGSIIHANRVAREYTGLTLDEYRSIDVIGRVIHHDDSQRMRGLRERGFSGSAPFELEARMLGKDGLYRWFLFRYNPLVEGGCVKKWYSSATEIDARKLEEERVRKENVRLEERTRIARALHDTLLQSFLAALMQLGATIDRLPSDSLVKPQLDPILHLMAQGIEEGRDAIQDLRVADPPTPDLVQALSEVHRELAVRPDIDFRVSLAGQQKLLQPFVWQEVYRIGREALANTFRHSGAKRVDCELEYTDSNFRMRLRDNGCGISPQVLGAGRAGHWGLTGMQERAMRIGGLLRISSSATAGTEVQLSVPGSVAFNSDFPWKGTETGVSVESSGKPLTKAVGA
jgi:PAS domain S-box-containing protein